MITLHHYTGPSGTESGPLAQLTFLSIDGEGDPNTYPVPRGGRSYERWLRAKTTTRASRFWVAVANVPTGVTVKMGTATAYTQPTNAASTVATRSMTPGDRYMFETLDVTTATRYLVLQVWVDAAAATGQVSSMEVQFGWHEDAV